MLKTPDHAVNNNGDNDDCRDEEDFEALDSLSRNEISPEAGT